MIFNIIIYSMFYIIGVVLGSFFTLAIYRIPLKQDITHTRSYCPNCNHELNFLDLIPIISYLFLKGKCRYCHKKINKRYILIEALSGALYVLLVISLKINFLQIELTNIVLLLYKSLMFSVIFIVAGIEKEKNILQTNVLSFGIIIQALYMVYLCILKLNIYRYIIYLLVMIALLLIRKKIDNLKNKDIISFMFLLIFSFIATNEIVSAITLIILAIVSITKPILKIKKQHNYLMYFCFLNILIEIAFNFYIY